MISIKQERFEDESDDSSNKTTEDHSSDKSETDVIKSFVAKSSKVLRIVRECTVCKKPCKTKLELFEHTAKCCHHAFVCKKPGCPFASIHKQHYDYHMNWHDNKKDIRCERCEYSCSTTTMLKSHLRTHQGFMRFRCADCTVTTKQPSALSQHLASTGHKAAPVLKEDGNAPDNDKDGDFKTHIRQKRRMKEVHQVVLPKKMKRGNPQQTSNSSMNLPANEAGDLPIRIEPIDTSESDRESDIVIKNEPIEVKTEAPDDSPFNSVTDQPRFCTSLRVNLKPAQIITKTESVF